MSAFRPALSVLLIFSVLSIGLPRFSAQDVNRDREIDLGDAVSQMCRLIEATESSKVAWIDIQKAIVAINATAGLETVIQSAADHPFDSGQISQAGLYLLRTHPCSSPVDFGFAWREPPVRFESMVDGPAAPPPEMA